MRLIDVETAAAQPADHDRAATRAASGPATTSRTLSPSTAEAGSTLALHAVAKFLDAFLEFIFAADPEILRAALRPGDADGFRWPIGPSAVQWETAKIRAALPHTGISSAANSGISTSE